MTDGNAEESEVTSLLVRSTIALPDIGMGALVYVDPRVPYIAGCIARGFLVPVVVEEPETAEVDEHAALDIAEHRSMTLEQAGQAVARASGLTEDSIEADGAEQLEVTAPEQEEDSSRDDGVEPEDAAAAELD